MNGQKVKIAIIEDDMAIVQMYRMKFEHEGYEVATAPMATVGWSSLAHLSPTWSY